MYLNNTICGVSDSQTEAFQNRITSHNEAINRQFIVACPREKINYLCDSGVSESRGKNDLILLTLSNEGVISEFFFPSFHNT